MASIIHIYYKKSIDILDFLIKYANIIVYSAFSSTRALNQPTALFVYIALPSFRLSKRGVYGMHTASGTNFTFILFI